MTENMAPLRVFQHTPKTPLRATDPALAARIESLESLLDREWRAVVAAKSRAAAARAMGFDPKDWSGDHGHVNAEGMTAPSDNQGIARALACSSPGTIFIQVPPPGQERAYRYGDLHHDSWWTAEVRLDERGRSETWILAPVKRVPKKPLAPYRSAADERPTNAYDVAGTISATEGIPYLVLDVMGYLFPEIVVRNWGEKVNDGHRFTYKRLDGEGDLRYWNRVVASVIKQFGLPENSGFMIPKTKVSSNTWVVSVGGPGGMPCLHPGCGREVRSGPSEDGRLRCNLHLAYERKAAEREDAYRARRRAREEAEERAQALCAAADDSAEALRAAIAGFMEVDDTTVAHVHVSGGCTGRLSLDHEVARSLSQIIGDLSGAGVPDWLR